MKTSIVALALLASRTRADVSLGGRLTPAVARSAVASTKRRPFELHAAQNLRHALLIPLHQSEKDGPLKRRYVSIITGVAILAMQAALIIALHVIRH